MRQERLNENWLVRIDDAQEKIDLWWEAFICTDPQRPRECHTEGVCRTVTISGRSLRQTQERIEDPESSTPTTGSFKTGSEQ